MAIWTKFRLFLAILYVITGSINTVSIKWADMMEAESSDGQVRVFVHPFLQAIFMFTGEIFCLITFKIAYYCYKNQEEGKEDIMALTKGTRDFNPLILLIPAMCDMTCTCIMNIGLNLTYASSYQMFRGSVIIFVAILSIVFLGRRLIISEWVGMFFVILGLVLVGLADMLFFQTNVYHSQRDIIIGDTLIITSQISAAVQFVVEEKYVARLDIPALQAIGWEGVFGFIILSLLQFGFYFLYVGEIISKNPRHVLEDCLDGFVQMRNEPFIILASIVNIISIAFFNFAGISITKEFSATTRMVLDSTRTVVIWFVSLFLFNQKFQWLQLVGFIVLLYGIFLYNGFNAFSPLIKCCSRQRDEQDENVENPAAATAQRKP